VIYYYDYLRTVDNKQLRREDILIIMQMLSINTSTVDIDLKYIYNTGMSFVLSLSDLYSIDICIVLLNIEFSDRLIIQV